MEKRAEQLIEAFFSNELTAQEAAELDTLAKQDPEVAQELAFQRKIAASTRTLSLSDSIQNPAWQEAARKPFRVGNMRVSVLPRFMYAVAAALALLVAAYLFFWQPMPLPKAVIHYASDYPNKMRFKSFGAEVEAVPPDVARAFKLYDSKAYRDAADALSFVVARNPDRMDYRFYLGVASVKCKQYALAADVLELVTQTEGEYQAVSQFYMGLACAGKGDKEAARKYLKAYIAPADGVSFRKEAEAVLKSLR
jgi:tetratricopeptide (TPR) repeat protein